MAKKIIQAQGNLLWFGCLAVTLLALYTITNLMELLLLVEIPINVNYILVVPSAIGICVACYCSLKFSKGAFSMLHLALLIVLLWPGLALFIQYSREMDVVDMYGRSALYYSLSTYGMGLLWFWSGVAMQWAVLPRANWLGLAMTLAGLLMLRPVIGQNFLVDYYQLSQLHAGTAVLTHLTIGEGLLFVFLVAMAFSRGIMTIFLQIVIIIVLFMIGGRTGLLAFIAAAGIGNLLLHSWRQNCFYFGICIVMLIAAAIRGEQTIFDAQLARGLLYGGSLSYDQSWAERLMLLHGQIGDLPAQSIYGDAGIIVKKYGSVGAAIHSVLAFWQYYGVIMCLAIAALWYKTLRHIVTNRKKLTTGVDALGVYLLLYTIIAGTMSRGIGFNLLWAALGFWGARLVFNSSAVSLGDSLRRIADKRRAGAASKAF